MLPRIVSIAAVGVLAGLGLTACQTVPVPAAPTQAWNVRRGELQALARFQLTGRVAVAVAGRGFNADLRWVQDGTRSRMTLSGPLGADAAEVMADGNDLSVVTSRGEQLGAAAAEDLLQRQLGFEPPLASLRYWVLGVPDPGSASTMTLDAQHRLATLGQGGWSIQYLSYMPVGAAWLPRLMNVQRSGVRLRLVVDQWRLL